MKREGIRGRFRSQSLFRFSKGPITMAKESVFQRELIKDLREEYPGCIITKLDANLTQGIPDLLILHGKHWATLECKRDSHASKRPNQNYYVDKMNKMSFSRFINPENKEEVLDELKQLFES